MTWRRGSSCRQTAIVSTSTPRLRHSSFDRLQASVHLPIQLFASPASLSLASATMARALFPLLCAALLAGSALASSDTR